MAVAVAAPPGPPVGFNLVLPANQERMRARVEAVVAILLGALRDSQREYLEVRIRCMNLALRVDQIGMEGQVQIEARDQRIQDLQAELQREIARADGNAQQIEAVQVRFGGQIDQMRREMDRVIRQALEAEQLAADLQIERQGRAQVQAQLDAQVAVTQAQKLAQKRGRLDDLLAALKEAKESQDKISVAFQSSIATGMVSGAAAAGPIGLVIGGIFGGFAGFGALSCMPSDASIQAMNQEAAQLSGELGLPWPPQA